MMTCSHLHIVFSGAMSLLCVLPLRAGDAGGESVPPRELGVRVFAVDAAEVKGAKAGYSVSGFEVEGGMAHWRIGVGRHWYDWDRPESFVEDTGGADPWERITRLRAEFSHDHPLSERWAVSWMAGLASDFEEEMEDSIASYVGGYGMFRAGTDWRFYAGLLYAHHPEVESEFEWVPVLGAAWRAEAEKGLSLRLGLPVTQACWHFNSRTRLSLDVSSIEGGVYRLADDNPVRPGGYVEMVGASVSLSLHRRIGGNLEVSAGLGHSVHRELTLYDADGGNAHSQDIDDAPSVQISIRTRF